MAISLNRNWLLLGGALALGGAAVYLSHTLITDRIHSLEAEARAGKQMVKVVVAKQDMERGTPLNADTVAVREVPAEYVHANAIRPDHFGDYAGARLGVSLRRGEPVLDVHTETKEQVFSSTLAKGRRALTFEVDEVNSISGMLRPTDRIDLILTARAVGATHPGETTLTLLSNVEVLATGQVVRKRSEKEGERSFSTVTLSLSPEDAQRVVVAKTAGKLTAVLRNPEDQAPSHLAGMGVGDLLGVKAPPVAVAQRRAVHYIVGTGQPSTH